MKRFCAPLLALIGTIPLMAAGVAPQRYATFSAEQRADLSRISAYLNAIHTLKGGFIQRDPNGRVEVGDFYLSKPGKMRFAYDPPNPLLVVSDGETVAVSNSKLKTVDRYPLTDTPLDLILSDTIDLNHNLAITGMDDNENQIVIRARSQSSHAQGDISILFARNPLALRQWTVIDAQGLATTVALQDVETGLALDDSLFVLRDAKNPFTRKGEE